MVKEILCCCGIFVLYFLVCARQLINNIETKCNNKLRYTGGSFHYFQFYFPEIPYKKIERDLLAWREMRDILKNIITKRCHVVYVIS